MITAGPTTPLHNHGRRRPTRRRSGSETRQRTRQKKLSLLPEEERVMQRLADEAGLPTIQQYILVNFIQPTVAAAS